LSVEIGWWKRLDDEWKKYFSDLIGNNPTQHDIILLWKYEIIDCSNTNITNLTPLRVFSNLKEVNAKNTNIKSLEPLKFIKYLNMLNIAQTQISSLSILKKITLKTLIVDINSKIPKSNIEDLKSYYLYEKNQILTIHNHAKNSPTPTTPTNAHT